MITSILIPTDFSPASWNATQFGLKLSKLNNGAKLQFLHVYPLPKSGNVQRHEKELSMISEVQNRMNKLTRDLLDQDEIIENIVVSGDVEEKLIEFIKETKSDLVIVGVNSNGVNNEIGRHTINVIEKSGVPVLIVPNTNQNGVIAS